MDPILEGAAKAIEQKGADFTMDYLAKSIRISKRTIYEKYNSKEEIISLIFEARMKDIAEQHRQVLDNPNLPLEDKLRAYFAVRSRVFNTFSSWQIRSVFEKVPTVIHDIRKIINDDWKMLRDFLEEEKRKGSIKEDTDLDVFFLIFRSLSLHVMSNSDYSLEELREIMRKSLTMLMKGIENREA